MNMDISSGDIFALPLINGWAGGLVTFVGRKTALLCVFPLFKFDNLPDAEQVLEQLRSSRIYETRVGRLGFEMSGWKIVGHTQSIPHPFDELPGFFLKSANSVAIIESDLLTESKHVPLREYRGRIARWGVAGDKFVSEVMESMAETGQLTPYLRDCLPPGHQEPSAASLTEG